ncbi:insulinase family protein [Marinospirillum alkaliphilum]|uniref:Protease 3 n=1 Tax=Marinospirillum alkaliphilum DSM 21637 TaxID=1122209 RepID=A0A1K1ZVH1_9GAMM|nr:insulinase family protein [Marinospirillum alkaliphilum]SFX77755.1 Secreted Zn-dependent peptidases, insulinase-like [Marinospirillum alkaliphilum DSM 21637]
MNGKIRFILITLTLSLTLSACSMMPFQTKTLTPVTSPNDSRSYAGLQLPNGLRVLVISDAEADRAAASMNVAAGSFHEPDEWPGLAHFLEHMLFLGTATFPEADAYQRFISQHGGSHNAFTAPRDTNYFFDIQPDHLNPALERMSRFFIDPLFSPEYMEREVNAVNSEWSGTLQDDARRRLSALRQAFNPEHPASRFSAGNRETLDINNPALREAMLDFHQQYYTPDRMTLVVLGPQPIHELRAMVQAHFAAIQSRPASAEPVWPELIRATDLPALLEIQPLRQQRQLQLLFPITDPTADYRLKPDRYLAGLIGHEGEGSLLQLLKQRGWATGLSAGSQMQTGQEALFGIHIELTASGNQQIEAIKSLVFAHLELIRNEGIVAWRFEEDAAQAANAFRFAEPGEARNLVTHLAMNMARYPFEDVLRAHHAFDRFSAERIQSLLDQLTPERLLAVHVNPDATTDQTAPWVPAEYRLTRPVAPVTAAAQTATRLPDANPFMPSSLALHAGANDAEPRLLPVAGHGLQLWHGQDTSFKVPRAQWFVSLQNPDVATDLNNRLLAQLTAQWLNDQLNAPGYPARLAGIHYEVYPHSRGITLSLGGFNEGQPRLLMKMLDQLQQAQVDKGQFLRLQQTLEQNLRNQQRDRLPQQLIRELYRNTLQPGGWTLEEQLKALAPLTADDLKAFIPAFTARLHVQLLAWGNVTEAEALQLANQVEAQLQPSLTADAVDLMQIRQIPPGQWSEKIHPQHNDRAILYYIQGQRYGLEEEAQMRLLAHLQSSAFFHELRTRQQLGYAVFSNYLPLMQQPGLFYFIQSPAEEPDYLAEAIEVFLREDIVRLERLEAADFNQHRNSLISQLLEADKRLGQRAERFWREIGNSRQDFTHRQRLANTLKDTSQEQLIHFYEQLLNRERGFYLLGSTPERRGRLLPGQEARSWEWQPVSP